MIKWFFFVNTRVSLKNDLGVLFFLNQFWTVVLYNHFHSWLCNWDLLYPIFHLQLYIYKQSLDWYPKRILKGCQVRLCSVTPFHSDFSLGNEETQSTRPVNSAVPCIRSKKTVEQWKDFWIDWVFLLSDPP